MDLKPPPQASLQGRTLSLKEVTRTKVMPGEAGAGTRAHIFLTCALPCGACKPLSHMDTGRSAQVWQPERLGG